MRAAFLFIAVALVSGCVPTPTTSTLPLSSPPSLYVPRDVQQAYKKGTRSADGRPGANYWQNRARYNIAITALPPDRNIKGSEQITYLNNSPDTLRTIVVRLFLNIHKPGAPRNFGAAADYLTPGVQIDSMAVNGQPAPWPGTATTFTVQRIRLATPLLPHDSLQLSFK